MGKRIISSLLILFIIGNLIFTAFIFLSEYFGNKSLINNIANGFVNVCSNVGNILAEFNNNDKTVPVINHKNFNNTDVPVVFTDNFTFNSVSQYKYELCDAYYFKFYSLIKKHIVDKPDRTENIFLLLLLQILIFLIVLNMCKYLNNFHLDINKITLSLRTV